MVPCFEQTNYRTTGLSNSGKFRDENMLPDRASISRYALMELSPEYMIRLFDDFRNIIIEGR